MKSYKISKRAALLAGTVLSLGFQDLAHAQGAADDTEIETIFVTAAKRVQNIQDVPSAVTSIGGEALTRLGATDISDFVGRAPGLDFQRTDRSSNRLSIRGLTSLTSNVSEFPMVGSYVDDVPISETNIPDIGLIDLERIEVLRGPQGTLYGEGSMGGTVKFITKKPDLQNIEGFASAEASTTRLGGESFNLSGALNLPIAEDVAALRLVGFYEDDGGFVDNAGTGVTNADAFDRYGMRASLRVAPTEDLTIDLTGMYQEYDGGIPPMVFPNEVPGLTPPNLMEFGEDVGIRVAPTFNNDEVFIVNGVINYDFGFATLTSSTSYYDRNIDGGLDENTTARIVEQSLTPLTTFLGLGPFTLTNGVQTAFERGNETFAQEVRLASNGDTRLRYTVGAYYRTRDVFFTNDTRAVDVIALNDNVLVPNGLSGNPNYAGELQIASAAVDYRQFAVFGEAAYEVIEDLDLIVGLRYFDERVQGNQSITATAQVGPGPEFLTLVSSNFPEIELNENDLLWKFGASYEATDDILIYAQAAQGFRPGGVNARANPTPGADSPVTFGADDVTSYEIGVKTVWLDRRLTVNVAAYLSDLDNAQFSDPRDPVFPVVRNSGGTTTKGIEIELTAYPTDTLQFGLNASFLSAEFSEDALPVNGLDGNPTFLVLDGQAVPIARDVTITAFGEWTTELTDTLDLLAYGDISYADGAEVSTSRADTGAPGTFYTLDDYVLMNAQIGVVSDQFSVTLFVDNLTDEFAEFGGSISSGISRNKPRTFGLRGRFNF